MCVFADLHFDDVIYFVHILQCTVSCFQGIKNIETDLGISRTASAASSVDPVGNFPYITDKHRSLACKALKSNPELYAKYANVKTPMGFTFDQAIQAGLDAPHLGVGISAGKDFPFG